MFNSEELERFKYAQHLAYACALEIKKDLKEGWTERQTAQLMDTYLYDHGVRAFFHKSFAWFGNRTRFQNFTKYRHFMPSETRLRHDDVIILDTAPLVEGYPGDIGYTYSLEHNLELERAKTKLRECREILPKLFSSSMKNSEIWCAIDQDLKGAGFDNIHSMYPFSVLGHQVHRVPLSFLPGVIVPFSLHSYWMFLSRGVFKELLSPKNISKKVGLWALEPHLGGNGFGAKFEEILVVEKDTKETHHRAWWLDNDVPHIKEAQ